MENCNIDSDVGIFLLRNYIKWNNMKRRRGWSDRIKKMKSSAQVK